VRVEGVDRLIARLQARIKEAENVSVVVGYTAAYAIFVHEDLEANHPNGEAKFLERPARERSREIGNIVREAMKRGVSMRNSLLLGGLYLQRESQELVPVKTGNLRASAFTEVDE
jgi:hypothetical protein